MEPHTSETPYHSGRKKHGMEADVEHALTANEKPQMILAMFMSVSLGASTTYHSGTRNPV